MYVRKIGDRELTLGVSGQLWQRSLVMYDKETESSWSHILGEAMAGPLKGSELEQIPSVITAWKNWRQGHPAGTVALLPPVSRRFTKEFFRDLDAFVLGISQDNNSAHWRFSTLKSAPVRYETWLGERVVIFYDRPTATARMFLQKLGGRLLTFDLNSTAEQISVLARDNETGSTWNIVTGVATAGPLAGQHLTPQPAFTSFRRAWITFHPQSEEH